MGKFLDKKYRNFSAYIPGEQPSGKEYIKLNTNESPFDPSCRAIIEGKKNIRRLNLYPDPNMAELKKAFGNVFAVPEENLVFTNGSDEILNFIFMSLCENGIIFPSVTYGLYPILAKLYGVKYEEIPMDSDFIISVDAFNQEEYKDKTVILANPNSPTGRALGEEDIRRLLDYSSNRLVVIDQAYSGFGSFDSKKLVGEYENLLITGTFSKGMGFAGGRLGYGIGDTALIKDLDMIRFSVNPYNVNSLTEAIGLGILRDYEYVENNNALIKSVREWTSEELIKAGFKVIPSESNFVFAKSEKIGGRELYEKLKEQGILVRHFSKGEIEDYIRITIGKPESMETFIKTIRGILNMDQGNVKYLYKNERLCNGKRFAEMERNTLETQVRVYVALDGTGEANVDTGIGFMDHMLTLFARYSGFDLYIKSRGDLYVDGHHSVEDIGIVLGKVIAKALGDKRGILRYGSCNMVMDEALVMTAVDLSGRFSLSYKEEIKVEKIGDLQVELLKEFFKAFAENLRASIHIRQIEGENSHHIVEGMFKSLGKSMKEATRINQNDNRIMSAKGVLE